MTKRVSDMTAVQLERRRSNRVYQAMVADERRGVVRRRYATDILDDDDQALDAEAVALMEDEGTLLDRALGMMTAADGPMVLAASLLVNLAEDLAWFHRHDFWQVDPLEMLARENTGRQTFCAMIFTHDLCREMASPGVARLYEVITDCSGGKVKWGRGHVVRLAKTISGSAALYKRSLAARATPPGKGGRRAAA